MEVDNIILNNGVKIPCIGLGSGSKTMCWGKYHPFGKSYLAKIPNMIANKIHDTLMCKRVVKQFEYAFECGYHFIDWSAAYGRGELIRQAINNKKIKREDLFITSRVSNNEQYQGNIREAFFKTINALGVDYLDLYLFHWPVTDHYIDTYKEMEKLYKEGLVKAIGVCNCKEHHLQKILDECEVTPSIDQFEVHPLFTQKPLIKYCEDHGIHVMAYTPLARNDDRLQKNLILKRLCNKYNKNWGQIVLRWDIQNGLIPIPRSSNPKRLAGNIDIFDFELTDDEMKAIDSININSRLRFDPDNLDFHSVG